ncbi:dihydrofolate reductase family protein [Actinocorallia populi]|uniref:dihydrofolate reductase family protein n=1 Tax=Actinocorallia populi TaxID=2079200 RepID=UPI000D094D59|nr:dihydrofolate reductase family protein [Actinocorallia populi]
MSETTGKIFLMMSVSLDGFFEGPDREIGWHRVDEEVHAHFNERLSEVAAFVDGRVTYELMADYWPTADADPANAGPTAEFAKIWREVPKYVYSRTMESAAWNTTVIPEFSPEGVRELKERVGGDIALGGADLAAHFMRHGLVDEYSLYVNPVVLGRGRPLFPGDVELDLRLVETRTFGNGVVLLRYLPG